VCSKEQELPFLSYLKTSFKLKAVSDGADMKEVIVRLIQAYVDKKIKLDEI
jgi:hypothetical protein